MSRNQIEYKIHTAIVAHKRTAFPEIIITHAGHGKDKAHALFLSRMGYEAGTGDILWFGKSKFGEIEVKTKEGVQSASQKIRQGELERNGGHYAIVKSVQAAHDYWKSLGFKPMHEGVREANTMTWDEKISAISKIYSPQ